MGKHTYGGDAQRRLVNFCGSLADQACADQLVLVHLAQRGIVLVVRKELSQDPQLAQIRGQDDDAVQSVPLLAEVLDAAQDHLGLERVSLALLAAGVVTIADARVRVLLHAMVQEDDAVLQPENLWASTRLGSVEQVLVRQLPGKHRNLGRHAVLSVQRRVARALFDQTLKQGAVQIESLALLDGQGVVVDLGAQLLVVSDQHELLDGGYQGRQDVALEDLSRFFNQDDVWLGRPDQPVVFCCPGRRAADHHLLLHDMGILLAEQNLDLLLDLVELAGGLFEVLEVLIGQGLYPPLVVRRPNGVWHVPHGLCAGWELLHEPAGPEALDPLLVQIVRAYLLAFLACAGPVRFAGRDLECLEERGASFCKLQVVFEVIPLGREASKPLECPVNFVFPLRRILLQGADGIPGHLGSLVFYLLFRQKQGRGSGSAFALGPDARHGRTRDANIEKVLQKLVQGMVGVAQDKDSKPSLDENVGNLGPNKGFASSCSTSAVTVWMDLTKPCAYLGGLGSGSLDCARQEPERQAGTRQLESGPSKPRPV